MLKTSSSVYINILKDVGSRKMHRFRFFSLLISAAWLQTSGMAHALQPFANPVGDSTSISHDLVAHDGMGDRAFPESTSQPHPALQEYRLQQQYIEGVNDAAVPAPGENVPTLTPITPDNPHLIWNEDYSQILVVTWKTLDNYRKYIAPATHTSASASHVVWVTVAPEVQEFCQRYLVENPDATREELDLRLKQHLGLHYTWSYDVFVELWVDPDDLFRPCVDPEITDGQCSLNFDAFSRSEAEDVSLHHVPYIENYHEFYSNLYARSFRGIPGVPWTGLGYTYDWGSPVTEVGASEFIMVPNAAYRIHQVRPTLAYCSAPASL